MFKSVHVYTWCAPKLYDRQHLCRATILILVTVLSVAFLLQAIYLKDSDVQENLPHDAPRAARLTASDLLARPLANIHEQSYMPKYIHQSWMTDDLPKKLSRWSRTCQLQHPDWQWILWTDEDNLNMVEKYFPWFLATYKALPAEINRADVARNMYMYIFGGVYADLDTECLKPLDQLFSKHGVSVSEEDISNQANQTRFLSTAFFGRMNFDNTDATLFHTIPNAWMASTPGLSLFLLVLERLSDELTQQQITKSVKTTAEDLTGPIALYRAIQQYERTQDSGLSPQNFLNSNQSLNLFERSDLSAEQIVILPPENIYPYPWNNAGKLYRGACWSGGYWFNSRRCKKMVVSEEETYTITYWSHTWNEDLGQSHDQHSLDAVGKE